MDLVGKDPEKGDGLIYTYIWAQFALFIEMFAVALIKTNRCLKLVA